MVRWKRITASRWCIANFALVLLGELEVLFLHEEILCPAKASRTK